MVGGVTGLFSLPLAGGTRGRGGAQHDCAPLHQRNEIVWRTPTPLWSDHRYAGISKLEEWASKPLDHHSKSNTK
jgi:hypothetical protein